MKEVNFENRTKLAEINWPCGGGGLRFGFLKMRSDDNVKTNGAVLTGKYARVTVMCCCPPLVMITDCCYGLPLDGSFTGRVSFRK